jgi:hypothetical protein
VRVHSVCEKTSTLLELFPLERTFTTSGLTLHVRLGYRSCVTAKYLPIRFHVDESSLALIGNVAAQECRDEAVC